MPRRSGPRILYNTPLINVNLVWSFSEVDQCVAITLYWPGNKSAQINASNLVARENSANIAGTTGEIEVKTTVIESRKMREIASIDFNGSCKKSMEFH